MNPYYDDGAVTLYLGDCLEVLPTLGTFDLVFTSPPYNLNCPEQPGGGFKGLGKDGKKKGLWSGGALADGYADHDDAMPMDEYEEWQKACLTAIWAQCDGAIFYNHKPRPWLGQVWLPLQLNPGLPLRQIIVWARAAGFNFAPTHYVPTYEWIMVFARPEWRLKSKEASGLGDIWREPASPSEHPAPFPVGLPARAIESAAPSSVLDPFAGSGTTLVAAQAAGVRAERYCEMAVRRLAQGSLFGATA